MIIEPETLPSVAEMLQYPLDTAMVCPFESASWLRY
jgi:hypothetical protein